MEVHRYLRNAWLITNLYVPRSERGIGVASLLLHKIIMKAKRHRIHTIYLENVLPRTFTLYNRFGFRYIRLWDNSMVLHVKDYKKSAINANRCL
jgi:GNAT superfamily N-acetyltransferase